METYNHTLHRGLGREQTPAQVHDWRELSLIKNQFKLMYKNHPAEKKRVSIDLTVGAIVRLQTISRTQYQLSKAYSDRNTEELFKVTRIDVTQKIPIYYLEDLAGEEVRGGF